METTGANRAYAYLMQKYGAATLTPTQFAAEVHRHPSHIRALLQRDELPGSKVGGRWIISVSKAAEIIDGNAY